MKLISFGLAVGMSALFVACGTTPPPAKPATDPAPVASASAEVPESTATPTAEPSAKPPATVCDKYLDLEKNCGYSKFEGLAGCEAAFEKCTPDDLEKVGMFYDCIKDKSGCSADKVESASGECKDKLAGVSGPCLGG